MRKMPPIALPPSFERVVAWYDSGAAAGMAHRHRDARRPVGAGPARVTAASMVINLDRRILYATDGQPDRGNFGIDRSRRKGAPAGGCFIDALDNENPA